jgi:hypothetical protein
VTTCTDIAANIATIYRPDDMVVILAHTPGEDAITGRIPFAGAAHVLETFDRNCDRSLYYIPNPVSLPPSPMRAFNTTARKQDISWRRRFLIDCDPERDHEIATDEQFQAALDVAITAREWLLTRGFTDVVIANSGNGVHLLPWCDLPNTPESEKLVKATQLAVSGTFSNQHVVIENFPDADRQVRAYGSLNRKGHQTDLLRWRRSGIIAL